MRLSWLSLTLLLLLVPTAAACGGSSSAVAPLLDLQFPDKERCKATDHSDCTIVPGYDTPFVMKGIIAWYWQVDNCEVTNPAFDANDIIITFPDFPRNPSWLQLKVEPGQIRVTPVDQWDFTDGIDADTQQVHVRNEYAVTVTITRIGEPTAEELDRLATKNNVVEVYAKAISSESPGFQPGFAFENFRLDASSVVKSSNTDSASNGAPAPAFGLLAVALAGLAVMLRRRN